MLKCINKGTYNGLTVGKAYEMRRETDGFFYLINDKFVNSRYHKKYFEIIADTIEAKPVAQVPKEVNSFDALQIFVDENRNIISLNLDEEEIGVLDLKLCEVKGSNVSTTKCATNLKINNLEDIAHKFIKSIGAFVFGTDLTLQLTRALVKEMLEEAIFVLNEEQNKTIFFLEVSESNKLITEAWTSIENIVGYTVSTSALVSSEENLLLVLNLESEE